MEKYFFNKIDNIHPFEEKENFSSVFLSTEVDKVIASQADPDYEQFLADVWVGIILTLIVLSCVCCMCSCLLYHKFQQWKRHILQTRNANVENGNGELESLPSYTIVSGLPSYAEALEQLKKVKEQSAPKIDGVAVPWTPHTPPTPSPMSRLSVAELFQIYKTPNLNLAVKN